MSLSVPDDWSVPDDSLFLQLAICSRTFPPMPQFPKEYHLYWQRGRSLEPGPHLQISITSLGTLKYAVKVMIFSNETKFRDMKIDHK